MILFAEELINLHKGQGFDIYWRDNNQCPSEDEYKTMVSQKKQEVYSVWLLD